MTHGIQLKLRKVPKDEIDKKVREAAKILDLDKLLDRKPNALSGGQRQRVAMGRAIVRNPKVFLMTSLFPTWTQSFVFRCVLRFPRFIRTWALQHHLRNTDQTEAMTLGTRIVVMKDGIMQQVDTPQNLYDKPCNLFVAGFIGSPQMNFMDAKVKINGNDVTLTVGHSEMRVPDSKKQALIDGNYNGKTVILGIRPEDIYEEGDKGAPVGLNIKTKIKFYELLGAEVYLYFDMEGTQMTARVSSSTKLKSAF